MMEESHERQPTLGDYWLLIRRRKWLFVVPSVIVFLLTAIGSLLLPNIYRASTLILVEAQKVPDSYVKATVSSPIEERLHTLTQQIKSHTRLQQVISELSLLDNLQDEEALERYIDKMRRRIEVDVKGNDAFTVAYAGEEPRTVMLVVNRLASLFIKENLKVREQHAAGTTEFLQEQLQSVSAQLEDQEKNISEFKQRHMGELPEQQAANQRALDRLQLQLQANLEATENARNTKRLLMQQMAMLPSDQRLVDVPGAGANPLVQQLAQLQATLAELQSLYTDDYPDIKHAKRKIADLQAQLAAPRADSMTAEPAAPDWEHPNSLSISFQKEIAQIDLQMQSLQREQVRIGQQIAAYEQKVASAAQREQELMVLTRDYESTRENYTSLLDRRMRAQVAENLEKRQKAEKFKVLDPAFLPTRPWKPNRLMILAMGLGCGLAVGYAAVFMADRLDRSFRSPEEFKQLTDLPVLAAIPLMLTAAEQRHQHFKNRLIFAGCVLVPVVSIAAIHLFWMNLDLVLARTWQLLNL